MDDGSLQNREELARKWNLSIVGFLFSDILYFSKIPHIKILFSTANHSRFAHFLLLLRYCSLSFSLSHCITMSSKLVRKLLQATEQHPDAPPTKKQKRSLLKKKLDAKEAARNVTTKEELLDRHISSLLQLDRTIAKAGSERQKRAARVVIPSKSKNINVPTLGNSRSSSSAMHQGKPLPTLDKKRIQKQRKEESLREVARLLKKTKKELAKTSTKKKKKSTLK